MNTVNARKPVSDRSQRRREATLAEIKTAARQQLVAGGPAAISLRAIARDMGMTAPALYRYYPSLDSLVLDLCTDLYTELRLACEAAPGGVPIESRLQEMAREFRRWVLAHPPEAALMFGPPLPGMEKFIEHCGELQDAGAQFGDLFRQPMARLGVGEAAFVGAWTRLYGV
ncbi:MAG: TetR/AcrR family transcriptional regulator, partial [Dehalococcoidia bacterium]